MNVERTLLGFVDLRLSSFVMLRVLCHGHHLHHLLEGRIRLVHGFSTDSFQLRLYETMDSFQLLLQLYWNMTLCMCV